MATIFAPSLALPRSQPQGEGMCRPLRSGGTIGGPVSGLTSGCPHPGPHPRGEGAAAPVMLTAAHPLSPLAIGQKG